VLLKGVGDRVNALRARSASRRSRTVPAAGNPIFAIAEQDGGGPAFADASLPGSLGMPSKPAHLLAVGH
jgi:hypothetical protein